MKPSSILTTSPHTGTGQTSNHNTPQQEELIKGLRLVVHPVLLGPMVLLLKVLPLKVDPMVMAINDRKEW